MEKDTLLDCIQRNGMDAMENTEGARTATSLADLDDKAVMATIGVELADDIADGYDLDGATYVYLDPYVDAEWQYGLMDKAAEIAGDAVWEHGARYAHELIDTVREELYRNVDDSLADWRQTCIQDVADRLLQDAEANPEAFGVSGVEIDRYALAAELEESKGLWIDGKPIDRIVESCTVPTTLIIGTRADFDGDWSPSRHVLHSAALWLEGDRKVPWEPASEGIGSQYEECSLNWLCRTQGCDLAEVVNGLDGDFAASVRDAILEDSNSYSWGWPMVGLMTTLSLRDFAIATFAQGEIGDAPFATVPIGAGPMGTRQPTIGLIDPVNGSGMSSPIVLERPIELTEGNIGYAMRDGVGGKWGPWWTSQEICGVAAGFDRPLRAPGDREHKIDRGQEKKGMKP